MAGGAAAAALEVVFDFDKLGGGSDTALLGTLTGVAVPMVTDLRGADFF